MAINWLAKLRNVAETASGVLLEVARQAEDAQRQRDDVRRVQEDADRANLARRAVQLTGRQATQAAFGQPPNLTPRPAQPDSYRHPTAGDPSAKLASILQQRAAMAERLKSVEDTANAEIKRRVEGRQGSDYHKAYTAAAAQFWDPVTRLRQERQQRDRVGTARRPPY